MFPPPLIWDPRRYYHLMKEWFSKYNLSFDQWSLSSDERPLPSISESPPSLPHRFTREKCHPLRFLDHSRLMRRPLVSLPWLLVSLVAPFAVSGYVCCTSWFLPLDRPSVGSRAGLPSFLLIDLFTLFATRLRHSIKSRRASLLN